MHSRSELQGCEKAKNYYGKGMCVCVLYDLLIKPYYIKPAHLRAQN